MRTSTLVLLISAIALVWLTIGLTHMALRHGSAPGASSADLTAPQPHGSPLSMGTEIPNGEQPASAGAFLAAQARNDTDSSPAPAPAPTFTPAPAHDAGHDESDNTPALTETPALGVASLHNLEDAAPRPGFKITTTQLPPAFVGEEYYVRILSEGGTPPLKWSVSSGSLPSGIALDVEHGALSGVPTAVEGKRFSLAAADASGGSASAEYMLFVKMKTGVLVPIAAGLTSSPLYITTGSLPNGRVGEQYVAQMDAQGGRPPYEWSVQEGALPDALFLGEASGLIQGVPSIGGKATFKVRVSDTDGNYDLAEYSIMVETEALSVLTASLKEGTVGSPYEEKLMAGGGSPPYGWSLLSGQLPPGISLDGETGTIEGTPEEETVASFVVGVTDAAEASASASMEIIVNSSALAITTESLPQGELDAPYECVLQASGGRFPYSWSLTEGELPQGLSLAAANGTISGVPSGTAGDYPIQVAVTDAAGGKASRALILPIAAPAGFEVSALAAVPSDGKVGLTWKNPSHANYSFTKIVRGSGAYPAGPDGGTVIYSGIETSFLDTGLQNNTTYYYSAFPYKSTGSAGAATDDSKAAATPREVTLSGPADPYADGVVSFQPLSAGGFGSAALSQVLGPPAGGGTAMGSTDVVSLHARLNSDGGATAPYGGSITLEFSDNLIVDGPGPDLVVFENVFYIGGDPEQRWMEPAIVSVSQDGERIYTFPFDFVPHFKDGGEINTFNPYCYFRGFAGINPVYSKGMSPDPCSSAAGGDRFDLSEIGLAWARYVRITSTGDSWLTDINGDAVRHTQEMGALSGGGSSGFDLDAVCAINY